MTYEEMNNCIASLSDEKLIKMTITAQEDCSNIKMSDIGGEWHVSCVAGLIVLVSEMEKRGLKA